MADAILRPGRAVQTWSDTLDIIRNAGAVHRVTTADSEPDPHSAHIHVRLCPVDVKILVAGKHLEAIDYQSGRGEPADSVLRTSSRRFVKNPSADARSGTPVRRAAITAAQTGRLGRRRDLVIPLIPPCILHSIQRGRKAS